MTSVLVIGGTGLISSAVATMARDRGYEVTVVTRGKSPVPQGLRAVQADRSNPKELALAFDRGYDAVIDAICYEPADASAIIELAAGRTSQYIFVSTVDTYPKPAPHYPVDESFPRGASTAFQYASKKVRCEEIIEGAARPGFATTIVRPAATYGDESTPIAPTLPFRMAGIFLHRLLRGEPLLLHGDGTSLWTSCHCDEVAAAIVAAVGNPQSFGRAYNLAGFEAITWNQYWQTIAKVMGAPQPKFDYIPTGTLALIAPEWAEWCVINFSHPGHYDSSAAHRELGFLPCISWEEGVGRMNLRDRLPFSDTAALLQFETLFAAWQSTRDAGVARALTKVDQLSF